MNIIELAREAGFNEAETEILKQEIANFAALVRAAALEQAAERVGVWDDLFGTGGAFASAILKLKDKT